MGNLLLVVLMIAALAGMVLCGRFRRRRPALQVIAFLLLLLVLVSGTMFMSRTGALSVLGFENETAVDNSDAKLAYARACVLARYIRSTYPDCRKILIIGSGDIQNRSRIFISELAMQGITEVAIEELTNSVAMGDELITDAADHAAEGSAIDKAIARYPDAQMVILSGITPTGESITRLKIYRLIDSRRPKIIILGLSRAGEWVAGMIEKGIVSAIVVSDLTKAADNIDKPVPDNPDEAFASRYVLINRDTLKRNRRFFR